MLDVLKVVILEDNVSYAWDYEMIMEKLEIQVVGVYKQWKDALPIIKEQLPDFIIVDLFLQNNEKGLDFIKQMKDFFIPMIVCTGYPEVEYMDEALEAGVYAFLSKPLDKSSLTFQVKKLKKELLEKERKNSNLIIKNKKNYIKIPYSEIVRIEIEGNYSFIYITSNKRYVLKISLKKITEKLDPKVFIRCHRSTIVNLEHIKSLDIISNKAVLSTADEVDIGSKFKAALKTAFFSQ